jgi:hypothetical protein
MIESLRNIFAGGWNTDSDKRLVRPNQFTDAQDVEFISDEEGSLNSTKPVRSMEFKYDIPAVESNYFVVRMDWISGNTVTTNIYNESGSLIIGASNGFGSTPTSYINNLNASISAYGVFASLIATDGNFIKVGFFSLPSLIYKNFRVVQIIDGIKNECPILQYANIFADNLVELASATIDDKAFVISAGTQFGEIGVYANGSYTRVYRSRKTVFTDQNPIDIRVEKTSDGRYAVYFTDNNLKPKVLYVPAVITTDCTQKYTLTSFGAGTSGYIVLGFEDEQTNLQLTANSFFVSFKKQLQGGGFLKSGGYRYAVRAGINGTQDTTQWSFLTPNVTPVFDTSTDSPNAFFTVQGTPGITTTKVNVLTIEGLNKFAFNFVEVAALYYVGTSIAAPSATIIGRYDINANTIEVNHIGNEIGTNLDIADIPQYDDIILKSENLEIKKNRLNLSSLFAGATISTGMTKLKISGQLESSNENILLIRSLDSFSESTIKNTSFDFSWFTSTPRSYMDKYNSFNTSTKEFVWPSIIPSGIIKCHFSYLYSADTNSSEFTLLIWKYPSSGGYVKYWSYNVNADQSNDNTEYVKSLDLEGSPNDKFKFMFSVSSADGKIQLKTKIDLKRINEDVQSITTGEYLDPENCSNKVGYMLNESYPFFARVHYKNGYISSPYYIGTHKFAFNSVTLNSDKIFTDAPSGTGTGNPLSQQNAYAYFANISNIPIGALRASADYISIWRGECNPSVLGTGVIMAADNIVGDKNFSAGLYPSNFTDNCFYPWLITDPQRYFGLFISPDTKLNKTQYSGGKIVTLGAPKVMSNNYNILGNQNNDSSQFGAYTEYYGSAGKNGSQEYNVLAGDYVDFASESQPLFNSVKNKKLTFIGDYQNTGGATDNGGFNTTSGVTGSMAGIAVALDNPLKKVSADTLSDRGIYIAQYIVETANQYDIQNVRIVPTGAKIRIDDYPTGNYTNVSVFGGDTYTQKNYIRLCYWAKRVSWVYPFVPSNGISDDSTFSSFIGYYGQARFNAQLTYNNGVDTPTFTLQGQKSVYDYLFPFKKIEDVVEEQFNYDAGYSAPNQLNRVLAYNSKTIQPSEFTSRIYFSDKKPVSAISDIYRKIKRDAFRDLDTKNGPIHGLIDQGDHMMALQPYAVTPLVYNTDAFVSTSIGGVQTTSGDVYPLNQVPVSTFGPSTKSAVLKGLNRNGNVTTYWISDWATKILRYGYDGVAILSDNFFIKTYLLEYMSKSNQNNDIVMGYRPRNQQVYISFKQAGQSNKITIGWNEALNIFTGRYSFTPFRFFTHNDYLFSNQKSKSVYSVATGTDYLKWYGSSTVNGLFVMEPVFNKMPEITKRAFAFALNVGEDSLNFPTATVYSSQYSSTTSNFEHRRGELVATSLANGNNDIMGQWINLRIESNSYINLLAVNLKVGYKRRLI